MKDSYLGLLALGEGHYIPLEEVALIAPISALESMGSTKVVNMARRRKPLTIILTRSEHILLSDLTPDDLAARYAQARLALAGTAQQEES